MSGSKSTSKTTPGYFDPQTQQKIDYADNFLYGQTFAPAPDTSGQGSGQGGGYGGYGGGGPSGGGMVLNQATGAYDMPKPAQANTGLAAPRYGVTGMQGSAGQNPGGYLGELAKKAQQGNSIFTGDGGGYDPYKSTYDPSNYQKQSGSRYLFDAPTMKETSLSPNEYAASQDMITKNASRLAQGNIDKMREADQYRGGGDLADYKASRENRNIGESTADQLRMLSEDYQKRLFEDRQGVNRYAAEADERQQGAQAGEEARLQNFAADQETAAEAARQFGESTAQAGEASRQFGSQQQNQYLQNQLAEQAQNTNSLQELMKILSGRSEAFKEGPTSTGSQKSFGLGM